MKSASYVRELTERAMPQASKSLVDRSFRRSWLGARQRSASTGFANRLVSDGTYIYSHENEGNLTKRTQKSDTSLITEYAYGHRNRLISVTDKNGMTVTQQVTYTYDTQGRQVKRLLDPDGAGTAQPTLGDVFVYDSNDVSGGQLALSFGATGCARAVLKHSDLHGPAGLPPNPVPGVMRVRVG